MKKITLIIATVCFLQTGNLLLAQKSNSEVLSKKEVTINNGNQQTTAPKNSKGNSKTSKPITSSKSKAQKAAVNAPAPSGNTPATTERVTIQQTKTQVLETPANVNADYNVIEKFAEPIIQQKTNGSINWTQQFVEAKGQAVIDTERFPNAAQAKAMATRGAVVVAQRNLLEIVKGVNVVGETTVQDMATTSDYIYTRVEGLVKGAEQVGQAREMNGMMEVTLKMPIYGKVSVASAIEENDIAMAQKKMGLVPMSAMNATENITAGDDVVDGSKPVVFNFKGKQIDPSMFPVIVDDKGNVKLDFSKLYDTKTGMFPKYMQLGKEIMQDLGLKKGVDVIELVQNANGQFTIPQDSKKKAVWQKIGNVAQKVGKILFSIL
jgi:hypothetical protein